MRCQELVEDVEISVGSRLATLEERSAKHQASMDERLKQLEQKVDDRLSRVEKVLEAVLKGMRSDSPEPL